MVKNQKIESKLFLFTLVIICLGFFAPFFLNPKILTIKDNDLGRNYIPIFNFIHDSFYAYKSLPLWRSEQMMGETLIGNPLSSLLYPANVLFLILPVNFAAICYLYIHFLIAGISTYFLARSFKLSPLSSFAAALFYTFSTKMLLHLSAGHITMIAAFSYFPLTLLSARQILDKATFFWTTIGAISLTFIYITYPTIFYYSVIFILVYWVYHFLIDLRETKDLNLAKIKRQIISISLVFGITLGLSAIILFPQLEFARLSTRSQLKLEDVALPLWNLKRFLTSLLIPYLNFDSFDHESFLYLGAVPIFLAFVGFWRLSLARKIILTAVGILTLIFVAGFSTPLFRLAFNFLPFLKYSRITTRLWFAVALVAAILAALALEKIKNKKIVYLLVIFFLVESFFIGYKKIFKISDLSFNNQFLYQYLVNDKDIFRVYCTTYCFNPQLASKYKIQLLAGENPIQDANFIKFLSQAGNYQFDKFAVIFPPYQVWQKENPPIPNSFLLGLANVKYVASTYSICSSDYIFINKFENIFLYKNNNFMPRVYFGNSNKPFNIQKYSPNNIIIKFDQKPFSQNLIFSENFYPGWLAYANNQNLEISKEKSVFRKVVIPPNTDRLEFRYQPESFILGKTLTLSTIFVFILYFWYIRKRR